MPSITPVPARIFRITAQHMMSTASIQRLIEAGSQEAAEATANRVLADTDYYVISSREVV